MERRIEWHYLPMTAEQYAVAVADRESGVSPMRNAAIAELTELARR